MRKPAWPVRRRLVRRLSGSSWLVGPGKKPNVRRPGKKPNVRRRTARKKPARGMLESRSLGSSALRGQEPPGRLRPARPSRPGPPVRFSDRLNRVRRSSRYGAGVPNRGRAVVRRTNAMACPRACSLCILRTAPAELSASSVSMVSRRAVSPVGESGRGFPPWTELNRGRERLVSWPRVL